MAKGILGILQDRERRIRLVAAASIVLALLLPVLGWTPLLVLWLVHLVFCRRETDSAAMRTFYAVMMTLAAALILLNLFMGLMGLHVTLRI